jgi:hypothetical protein
MAIRTSPVKTVSKVDGPVEVSFHDRVVAKYGNTRDAQHFARGFDSALMVFWSEAKPIIENADDAVEAVQQL